jgi:hypothetical protein
MKRKTVRLSNLSESLKGEVRKHMKDGRVNLNKLPSKIKGLVESEMAGVSDDASRRRHIKVTFEDGNTIETPINGTKKEIRDYYVDKYFNMGVGDEDKMVKALSVEFLSESSYRIDESMNPKLRELWRVLGISDSRDLVSSDKMPTILKMCEHNDVHGNRQYWFDYFNGTLNIVSEGHKIMIGVEDGELEVFAASIVYPLG